MYSSNGVTIKAGLSHPTLHVPLGHYRGRSLKISPKFLKQEYLPTQDVGKQFSNLLKCYSVRQTELWLTFA